MAKRYVIQEVPHPFKKGDPVIFAETKCVVKATSWEGDAPMVLVVPYENNKPPTNLGVPGYKIRAKIVYHTPVVDRLGDLSDVDT